MHLIDFFDCCLKSCYPTFQCGIPWIFREIFGEKINNTAHVFSTFCNGDFPVGDED